MSNGATLSPMAQAAYRALSTAAERMGAHNYAAGMAAHRKLGRSPRTYRYSPTEAHCQVVQAMADICRGTLTPNDAMAMLHEYDINRERLAQAAD